MIIKTFQVSKTWNVFLWNIDPVQERGIKDEEEFFRVLEASWV
jgi:hypothetical protein